MKTLFPDVFGCVCTWRLDLSNVSNCWWCWNGWVVFTGHMTGKRPKYPSRPAASSLGRTDFFRFDVVVCVCFFVPKVPKISSFCGNPSIIWKVTIPFQFLAPALPYMCIACGGYDANQSSNDNFTHDTDWPWFRLATSHSDELHSVEIDFGGDFNFKITKGSLWRTHTLGLRIFWSAAFLFDQ